MGNTSFNVEEIVYQGQSPERLIGINHSQHAIHPLVFGITRVPRNKGVSGSVVSAVALLQHCVKNGSHTCIFMYCPTLLLQN
jgi:hypothetical protein